jgi:hypothetical protein
VISKRQPYRLGVVAILSSVTSFIFRFRSRAALELKLVALQHQLAVLRRQRLGRPQLSSPAFMGVAMLDLAASHRRNGPGKARNGCRVASQGGTAHVQSR